MSDGKLRWVVASLVFMALLMMPALAVAQSAIAGTVTDSTGAVLPGVTIEARSPALIEQLRTGVTDDQGQYRIIDLRPGTYAVTFSLAGFSTVVREGIELPPNFTAPVNVQLRVGALEETVTVSGASPVVDVQTTVRREVVSQELIQTLPSGRTRESFMATIPAVRTTQFDVGGSTQMDNGLTAAYGGRNGDQNVTIDGMSVGSMIGDGSISIYIDVAPVQEYVVQTIAAGSDTQTGGVQINMVPKAGGNRFEHSALFVGSNDRLKSNNITPEFLAQGIKPQRILRAFDANGSSGGPIIPNRLWYFGSTRVWSFDTDVFNLFYNGRIKPAGTPAEDRNLIRTGHARLTTQLTQKNKLTVMHEHSWKSRDHQGIEQGNAYPEAINRQNSPNTQIAQVKWTSTMTNKLLLETGWSFNHFDQSSIWPKGLDVPTVADPYLNVRKVDLTGENRPYGSPVRIQSGPSAKHWVTSSLTYVTGTHALKGGVQFQKGFARREETRPPNDELATSLMQRYANGRPNSVVLYNLPRNSYVDMLADLGIYASDSWTRGRLTVNPGIRYDYFHGGIPRQSSAAGRWVPARSFAPVTDVPLWHDVTGRLGAAFDIFGDGKTAIKGSVGTYLWKSYTEAARLYNPMDSDEDTRNWDDLNGNDKAEANELGPTTNLLFGTPRFNRRMDPNLQRERNTLYNISFDHELFPGLGASIAFNRRTGADLAWMDNVAVSFDDYTLLTVPDPRGNGQMLPVYNISREKSAVLDRVDFTSESNTRIYNGFDVILHGRLPGGGQFFGGTSTGHTIERICEVDNPNRASASTWPGASVPPGLRFCDESKYDIPFQTFIKASGSYPLPAGFRVSVVYQHIPGFERVILYPVTRAVLPQLTLSSVNVRLNEPGSEYIDGMNQVDIGLAGTIRVGRTQVKPQIDLFNLLNSSDVLTVNDTYGSALGQPRKILFPRFVRFGLRVDF